MGIFPLEHPRITGRLFRIKLKPLPEPTTNTISWATRNPYAKDVRLDIVSAPVSEILVTKYVGRIGGYGSASEVYNPVVYFKSPPANTLYRVTTLLSRYSTEEGKTGGEIPVTGTGNALKVHSALYEDFIYTGKGNSTFDNFSTDADSAFIRKTDQTSEFTLLKGSSLKEGSGYLVTLTKKVDDFTLKKEDDTIKFKIQGQTSGDITLYNTTPSSVKRDGITYTNWISQNNGTRLKISTDFNDHEFEILLKTTTIPEPATGNDAIALFRPSARQFIFNTAPVTRTTFGLSTDSPITGDWNGDAITDIGVFRPSSRQFIFNTAPITRTTFGLEYRYPHYRRLGWRWNNRHRCIPSIFQAVHFQYCTDNPYNVWPEH